jgi:hypothetical protein
MFYNVYGAGIEAIGYDVTARLALIGVAEGAMKFHFGFFQMVIHFDFHGSTPHLSCTKHSATNVLTVKICDSARYVGDIEENHS